VALGEETRRWVGEGLEAAVVAVRPLTGGVASRMLLVLAENGREAVLRQLVDHPWRRHAEPLLRRERDVHGLLGDSAVTAPSTVALDVRGDRTDGDPSLLMTRLPGAVDLAHLGDRGIDALAAALLDIHAVRPGPGAWPREYESWATRAKRVVPPWSGDDGLYREAFARLESPAPTYDPTFLHRDFHPGNVLWEDGSISGVVDWVETSTGPADLDVAHCASNLAGLHGVETALAFRRSYVEQGGRLATDAAASAYWQLLDLVGFLPAPSGRESGAPAAMLSRVWAAHGRGDLTPELVRARREQLLRAILRS
jgi:aminoglycoside phosphotransferase (APT) family kinase protein